MAIGSVFRPLLELCREANVDVAGLLRQSGLTEKDLVDPETRLPPEKSRAIGQQIFASLRDPAAGLRAAERFRLEDADLIGYLARHSKNALEALHSLPRYARLIGDSAECRVTVAGGRVEVHLGLAGGRLPLPQAVDYAAVVFARGIRAVTHQKARLLQVRLSRPRPERVEPYRRALSAAIEFDSDVIEFVLAEAELATPFPEENTRLRAILAQRAESVLVELPAAMTLESQIRANLARRLARESLGLDAIARDLGMSERTLRRRLRETGHSYRSLVDAVRAERALALAQERRHTVTAIAEQVGFADPTAFARAFRRWTGVAPHEYLRQQRAC